jgi:hypothetical protein
MVFSAVLSDPHPFGTMKRGFDAGAKPKSNGMKHLNRKISHRKAAKAAKKRKEEKMEK